MEIAGRVISLRQLHSVAHGNEPVTLTAEARSRIERARAVVQSILERGDVVYGVSTGFGKFSDVRIEPAALRQLQLNLVRSHCCGLGQPLSIPEVRAMMLLRANVLALGLSGVSMGVVELLGEMLNRKVTPVVPEKGSVGA
ncbi:MAG: aromatic amino acid lyase, partial [Verrucomicrobiota bacterium]